MIHLPNDFKEFLELLNSKQIKYLLIGGYAVAVYGYPRATGDLDIWVAISPENARQIVEVLKQFGFDVPQLHEDLFLKSGNNIRMGNPPLRIEVITSIDGVHFDECYQHKNTITVDGIDIPFIALSDLRKNKKASSRYKDKDDLEHLPE